MPPLTNIYANFVKTSPDHLPKTSSQPKMKVGVSSSKTPQVSHSNHKQGRGGLKRNPETVDWGHGKGNGDSPCK